MEEKEQILELLRQKGVAFEEYEHEALANVMDRVEKGLCYDAVICKNLFVATRKKDRVFLVMLRAEKTGRSPRPGPRVGNAASGVCAGGAAGRSCCTKGRAPWGLLASCGTRAPGWKWSSMRACAMCRGWRCTPSVNTATVVLAFDELERIIRQNGNRIYYKVFQ